MLDADKGKAKELEDKNKDKDKNKDAGNKDGVGKDKGKDVDSVQKPSILIPEPLPSVSEGEKKPGEETEVLPYDSVFLWDLVDPLGFYVEMERYDELMKEYGKDQSNADVIECMWLDRSKYQLLQRFPWPPKRAIFYSRGYYEDYEARPQINVKELTQSQFLKDREERLKKTATFKQQMGAMLNLTGGPRKRAVPDPDDIINDSSLITDYDPDEYDQLKFICKCYPPKTNEKYWKKKFPKGRAKFKTDPKTGDKYVVMEFDDVKSSSDGFTLAKKEKLSGKHYLVLPFMKEKRKKFGEFDEKIYDLTQLEISNITDEDLIAVIAVYPGGTVRLVNDPTTKETKAIIQFPDKAAASEAYERSENIKINGRVIGCMPVERATVWKEKRKHAGKEWSEFSERDFDLTRLEIPNVPAGTTTASLQELFPGAEIEVSEDPKSKVITATATFANAKDTETAYDTKWGTQMKGVTLKIEPPKLIKGRFKRKKDLAEAAAASATTSVASSATSVPAAPAATTEPKKK